METSFQIAKINYHERFSSRENLSDIKVFMLSAKYPYLSWEDVAFKGSFTKTFDKYKKRLIIGFKFLTCFLFYLISNFFEENVISMYFDVFW